MAPRTGVPSLMTVAKRLCDLIFRYGSVIKLLYPSNTTLHAALDTANAACDVLFEELQAVREYGD